MHEILILNSEDIKQLFTLEDAFAAVEQAYRQKASGSTRTWPMVYEVFDPGISDMDIRSGELQNSGLFGLKLTAWFSKNTEQRLPEIYGTILICSNKTGMPYALLNASALTGLRTGAAAALGAKYLARPESKQALIIGSGHMAGYVAASLAICFPKLENIYVWNPQSTEAPTAAVKNIIHLSQELFSSIQFKSTTQITAVSDGFFYAQLSDIIATVTPATTPVIKTGWVKPGCHISAVGADMVGKQEIDPLLLQKAHLFTDDTTQSLANGEFEKAVKDGFITANNIEGELGEVMIGTKPGRQSSSEITIFDTSGIAIQDLASSEIVYRRALNAGLGQKVSL